MSKDYDVVIIGSGPAGLTAALYCGRARLSTAVIEKGNLGGAMPDIDRIENWPGIPDGISGAELAGNMLAQVMQYDVSLEPQVEAKGIELAENGLKKILTGGDIYLAKAVIIAGGTLPKELGIRGESDFIGKGISYCVMCEGSHFAGKSIAILGGGDTGITGALYMSRLGSKISIIEATPKLNASMVVQERLKEVPGIKILYSTVAQSIEPDGEFKTLKVRNLLTKEETILRVEGVFILAGRQPETAYLKGTVELDESGFIMVTEKMETNVMGVFAAGDIRSRSTMQLISGAGDGAMAAISAERFINARSW
jgi:thioredoxin reductase (NADPH)